MKKEHLIQSSINKDYSLILEAIERLKDGIWHLCDEDSDWANHLLPKVREALMEHIKLEDSCVLPELSQDLANEHSNAHHNILALLKKLENLLKSGDVDHFHASLELLIEKLNQHHDKFGDHVPREHCSLDNKDRIVNRSEKPSLEY